MRDRLKAFAEFFGMLLGFKLVVLAELALWVGYMRMHGDTWGDKNTFLAVGLCLFTYATLLVCFYPELKDRFWRIFGETD